jgi:hypothetical protein
MDSMVGYNDYQKQVEAYQESVPRGKANRYFVFVMKDGRYVDLGSEASETEAYELAYRDGGGRHFVVFPCNSVNLSEVHRRFKKYLLDHSHNLDEATSLISRKPAKEKQKREKPFGEGIF